MNCGDTTNHNSCPLPPLYCPPRSSHHHHYYKARTATPTSTTSTTTRRRPWSRTLLDVLVVGTILPAHTARGWRSPHRPMERCAGIRHQTDTHQSLDTTTTTTTKVHLVTHQSCPFAHKAWLALEWSHIPYHTTEIPVYGPQGKPDWFWKLTPTGTIPVVVVVDDETTTTTTAESSSTIVLTDSDGILDALDDPTSALGRLRLIHQKDDTDSNNDNHNHDPTNTNHHNNDIQWWRTVTNDRLIPQGRASGGALSSTVQEVLMDMNARVRGPYLTGSAVTVADCHVFPFVWRLMETTTTTSSNREDGSSLEDLAPALCQWVRTCQTDRPTIFQQTLPRKNQWWWWW